MSDNELAALLVKCAAVYFDRRTLQHSKSVFEETVKELDSYGVLSLRAIAAIVGVESATVRRIVGAKSGRLRGMLNPAYLGYIGLLLSQKKLVPELYEELLAHGTSISTIANLTNVSEATLYRWRKHG